MGTTRSARFARKETPEGEEQEGSDLGDDQEARLGRHVEATKDGLGDEQVAESSGKEAPGEEVPVEATDQEQGTQPSRAEICEGEVGPDRPDEAPDDGRGVQVAESRFMQVSGREVSDETPEGQEVAEPNSDKTAGMEGQVPHLPPEPPDTLAAKGGLLIYLLVGVLIGIQVGVQVGVHVQEGRRGGHLHNGELVVDLAGFTTTTRYRPGPINPDLPRWDQSKHKNLHDIFLTNICQDTMSAKEKSTPSNPQPNKKTCQHCRPKPSPSSTAVPVHHDPVHSDVRHQELQGVQGGGRVHVEEGQVPRLPPEPPDTHQGEQGPHQPGLAGGGRVQQDDQQGPGQEEVVRQEAESVKGGTPHRKLLANNKTCQHCRPKPSPSSTAVPIRHGPARGDVRHQELQDVQGGGRVHVEEGQVLRHPPAQGDAHHVRHAQAKEGLDAKAPRKGGVRVQADVEQVLRHPPAQGDAHHRTKFSKCFW